MFETPRGDKSHLVFTCDFEAATLARQKLHRVAATKIACVNGPVEVGGAIDEHLHQPDSLSRGRIFSMITRPLINLVQQGLIESFSRDNGNARKQRFDSVGE